VFRGQLLPLHFRVSVTGIFNELAAVALLPLNSYVYFYNKGDAMAKILAIYGSPRRQGNTAALLKRAVSGALDAGAEVNEISLRDLKMSPCLEIYGCKKEGKCVIKDDFHHVIDQILSAQGLILASPIFFYTVSAHTKILMDRCQSLWVKKYWIDKVPYERAFSFQPAPLKVKSFLTERF
jgi:hypothetical protein